MTVLYTTVEVTLFYSWGGGDGSTYTFGSLDGAKKYVLEKRERDDVNAYSIEVVDHIPCDENNPGGQLYGGMGYFEYREKGKDY